MDVERSFECPALGIHNPTSVSWSHGTPDIDGRRIPSPDLNRPVQRLFQREGCVEQFGFFLRSVSSLIFLQFV